jgi:hypothetical protein
MRSFVAYRILVECIQQARLLGQSLLTIESELITPAVKNATCNKTCYTFHFYTASLPNYFNQGPIFDQRLLIPYFGT